MPPPTSPENNPPSRGIPLPGLFEGIRNNSDLRHLVSRDFFARMNEISANLLSQYTEEQNRRNSSSSSVLSDTHEPGSQTHSTAPLMSDFNRRADESHIRTTALPAEIRNLASPVRFLVIPDLEGDPDFDVDLDEHPVATSSNVASRDTTAEGAERPDLAVPPFHLFLGSSSHEEDSSSSSWTSDDDAEFEEPSEQDLEDDVRDFDDESNSDDDSNSYDEDDEDDNSFQIETPEIRAMNAHSDLLDSMQSAQRLLLSSARQNPTNRNTLIITPESSRITSGVPLRRQNAIRVKPREPHLPQKSAEETARAYHAEFEDALAKIRASYSFPGKSPIFNSGRHFSAGKKRPLLRRWGTLRHSSRKLNLDAQMDKFLSQRRSGKLWANSSPHKHGHVAHVKRTHSRADRESAQKRHHRDTHFDLDACAAPNKPSNTKARLLGSKATKKRKHDLDALGSSKRQKTRGDKLQSTPPSEYIGDRIDEAQLSKEEKYRILSGMDSSFVSSGSSFSMGPIIDCLRKRPTDVLDMNFSHVDNENKKLHGYFNVSIESPDTNDYELLINFVSYLCGGIRSRYMLNCTNKVILSKASVLNDAFKLGLNKNAKRKVNARETIQKSLRVPFHGDIVDFNENDLRFLSHTKLKSRKSNVSSSIHHSRVRNEQVKLQLLEWLRIRPFSNFGEAFFLNYLYFVEKKLKHFDRYTKHEQELMLEFAYQFKESIYEVSREFEFVTDAIPMYKERYHNAMRDIAERLEHEPRYDLPKSFFLLEWESKLCEKLCEHITHEDSCLFNVQLNYVLFFIRVDVSKVLDEVFYRFLENVKDEDKVQLVKRYEKLNRESLSDEAKEAVFVCSVNRKTGRLEMQNTRSYLDYKYAGSCNSGRSSFRSRNDAQSDSDEDELGPLRRYTQNSMHWKCLEDPYLMHTPTMMFGKWKRTAEESLSCGGGHARSDFA